MPLAQLIQLSQIHTLRISYLIFCIRVSLTIINTLLLLQQLVTYVFLPLLAIHNRTVKNTGIAPHRTFYGAEKNMR